MQIIIETFVASGESSSSLIRARAFPGQGFPSHVRVECSKSMRSRHPVGTLFLIWATWKSKLGGPPFLYSSYRAQYEVLNQKQAEQFIKASDGKRARNIS
jgi:hypothetical protein